MHFRLVSGSLVAALIAAAAWGCGGGGGGGSTSTPTAPSAPSTPAPPATTTVTVNVVGSIGNAAYQPNPVRAATGDTVMFRNNDSATHRIVMDDGSADLGDVAPGATSRGFTVRNATALQFHCSLHPSMVGSINGATAPEPPPCRDPYGYDC
jgi:plastocyanin